MRLVGAANLLLQQHLQLLLELCYLPVLYEVGGAGLGLRRTSCRSPLSGRATALCHGLSVGCTTSTSFGSLGWVRSDPILIRSGSEGTRSPHHHACAMLTQRFVSLESVSAGLRIGMRK